MDFSVRVIARIRSSKLTRQPASQPNMEKEYFVDKAIREMKFVMGRID